ncbi:peroxiredoxin-like 2C isoform X2 [Bufo gargarizans]|uniref:peroxiredoxin-like 2C isoform X2 n=1 Tax=Bufo gargarizans TaxID=30331 RepID=UPI001CF2E2E3|nr:peroxiredoxin-like 2C isoform X2 [Bufo gargarizans]
MATESFPVIQQIGRSTDANNTDVWNAMYHPDLELAATCLVRDQNGNSLEFGDLYRDRKAIIIFVRNFLCYTCKEYVEDLAKIPKSFLQQFCALTRYNHEIYVDTNRDIYCKLGMKKGESSSSARSPHVKSNMITGSIKSLWRAIQSPAFDFQGDPAQQGGALIVGPGNRVHFLHRDMNRYDQVPISTLLCHAGVQTVHFGEKPQILECSVWSKYDGPEEETGSEKINGNVSRDGAYIQSHYTAYRAWTDLTNQE